MRERRAFMTNHKAPEKNSQAQVMKNLDNLQEILRNRLDLQEYIGKVKWEQFIEEQTGLAQEVS